jgi:hypothetical protein
MNGPVPTGLAPASGPAAAAADGQAEQVGEAGVGRVQLVGDGEVVDDHHLHVGQAAGGVGARRLEVVVEDRLQRLGVEGRAVVKRDVGPQFERPLGEIGVGLDRLGQIRLHLAVGVDTHQRVVDRVRHRDARIGEAAVAGQPTVGLGLEADGDRPSVDRVALFGDVAGRPGGIAVGARFVVVATAAAGGDEADSDECPQEPHERTRPSGRNRSHRSPLHLAPDPGFPGRPSLAQC